MNRAGFSTVEVIIASALIVALITGGAIGMRQINLLNQTAATRTSHTEMRTRVYEALLNSGECAKNLGQGLASQPVLASAYSPPDPAATVGPTNVPVPTIYHTEGTFKPLLNTGDKVEGQRFSFALLFPRPLVGGTGEPFPASLGRPNIVRHRALLEIRADREDLALQGGRSAPVVGSIPISMNFDEALGTIESCTIVAQDMEELLAPPPLGGPRHSVRECLEIDGTPMPTDIGLVCRVPYTVLNRPKTVPNTNCVMPGWQNAVASGTNYNTTLATDADIPKCRSGTQHFLTGYHYFSRTNPEAATHDIKKGASKFATWAAGGATFAMAAFVGALTGLLPLALFFVLLSKCKKESFTLYAQVNGVGCL